MSAFFLDAAERLCKTFVQAFLAMITASGLGLTAISDTSIVQRALVSGLAAVFSLLTSWLSRWATSDKSTASLVKEAMAKSPAR